jgi:hypothetical protein
MPFLKMNEWEKRQKRARQNDFSSLFIFMDGIISPSCGLKINDQ